MLKILIMILYDELEKQLIIDSSGTFNYKMKYEEVCKELNLKN